MPLASKKRLGFQTKSLHRRREPSAFQYLTQKSTFWIAVLSLIAFVAGNMMGQHGWHAFWKSVWGKVDDSLIVYTGTVAPIKEVPDYSKWWMVYGGNPEEHTYKQVPKELFVPLPKYDLAEQRKAYEQSPAGDVYSIGYMGSYKTGAEMSGSHNGVDIRAPQGTPVLAFAAGVVEKVTNDAGGFGNYVTIRHPNIPDPDSPLRRTTTLYSTYAHLKTALVTEGSIVKKGDQIGEVGNTGLASGFHLHFQIDRADAPFHPYWVFNTAELREAGLSFNKAIDEKFHQERGLQYSVNPVLYAQASYAPVSAMVAKAENKRRETLAGSSITSLAAARRTERIRIAAERKVALASAQPIATPTPETPPAPVIVQETTVVTAAPAAIPPVASNLQVQIVHDGSTNGRSWEDVTLILRDNRGEKVRSPDAFEDIYLRTAYGRAEFNKDRLSLLDFEDGVAKVQMLPLGRTTIVIQVQPMGSLSEPMRFEPR